MFLAVSFTSSHALTAAWKRVDAGAMHSHTAMAPLTQALQHGAFMQLLRAVSAVLKASCEHVLLASRVLEDILAAAGAPAGQVSALKRECAAVLQVR